MAQWVTMFGAIGLQSKDKNFHASVLSNADCVGVYFSAHWCPPCRGFTPQLAEIYKSLQRAGKKFEVVYVSSDQDQASFDDYFSQMPWLALPYNQRERKDNLSSQHGVSGIPSLVLLDKQGSVITTDGRSVVLSDPSGSWIGSADKAEPLCKWGKDCHTKDCEYKHGDSRDKKGSAKVAAPKSKGKGRGTKGGAKVGGAKGGGTEGGGAKTEGGGGSKPTRKGKGGSSDVIKAVEKKIRDLKAYMGETDGHKGKGGHSKGKGDGGSKVKNRTSGKGKGGKRGSSEPCKYGKACWDDNCKEHACKYGDTCYDESCTHTHPGHSKGGGKGGSSDDAKIRVIEEKIRAMEEKIFG